MCNLVFFSGKSKFFFFSECSTSCQSRSDLRVQGQNCLKSGPKTSRPSSPSRDGAVVEQQLVLRFFRSGVGAWSGKDAGKVTGDPAWPELPPEGPAASVLQLLYVQVEEQRLQGW